MWSFLSVVLLVQLLFENKPLWSAVRQHWFDSGSEREMYVESTLSSTKYNDKHTWMASTVPLSDSLTILCFLASSSLYLPTSLTISFNFWAICNWSWATLSQDVFKSCHNGVNVHNGPIFGVPLVALFAAAMLVEEPHCLANFPSCLLYVSSKDDLVENGK